MFYTTHIKAFHGKYSTIFARQCSHRRDEAAVNECNNSTRAYVRQRSSAAEHFVQSNGFA